MSIMDGLARFASAQKQAQARRRTERLLDSLPDSVQKDIGWRWSPRLRGKDVG